MIFNTEIKRIEREREEARLEIEKENVIQRKLEAVVQEETMREIIDLLKPSETQTGDALARAREYRYGKRWKIKTIKGGITESKKRMEQYLAREEILGEEKAEKRKKKSVESAFRKWHKQSVGKKWWVSEEGEEKRRLDLYNAVTAERKRRAVEITGYRESERRQVANEKHIAGSFCSQIHSCSNLPRDISAITRTGISHNATTSTVFQHSVLRRHLIPVSKLE